MQRDDGHGGDQGMCGDSVGDDSSHRQQAEEHPELVDGPELPVAPLEAVDADVGRNEAESHPEARLRARLPANAKLSAAVTPVCAPTNDLYISPLLASQQPLQNRSKQTDFQEHIETTVRGYKPKA